MRENKKNTPTQGESEGIGLGVYNPNYGSGDVITNNKFVDPKSIKKNRVKTDDKKYPMVSISSGYADPNIQSISVGSVFDTIKGDQSSLTNTITRIRTLYNEGADKKDIDNLKHALPVIIPSMITATLGGNDGIHTGLMMVDIDGKDHPDLSSGDILSKVKSMGFGWIVGWFMSPKGDGIKVLCRVYPSLDHHKGSFLAVQECFANAGLAIDNSCSDVKRKCFFSKDEQCFMVDIRSWGSPVIPCEVVTVKPLVGVYDGDTSVDNIQRCLDHIDGSDRDTWLRVGMALRAEGDDLFDIWHDWSSKSDGYKSEDDCIKTWNSLSVTGDVKMGSIVYLATEANNGVNPCVYKAKKINDPDLALDYSGGMKYFYPSALQTHDSQGAMFAHWCNGDLRWISDRGVWIKWDDLTGWSDCDLSTVPTMVSRMSHDLRDDIARNMIFDEAGYKKDRPDAEGSDVVEAKKIHSESKSKLKNKIINFGNNKPKDDLIRATKQKDYMSIGAGDIDSNVNLFACKNGVYDLQTQTFRPHAKEDYISTRSGVVYDPDAKCLRWSQFVNEVCCGDVDMVDYMHRMVGYMLTGDVTNQVWFFFSGGGSNGKSKIANMLDKLLGGYSGKIQQCLYAGKTSGMEQLRAAAELKGRRLVTGSELSKGMFYNDDKIKEQTGGDKITACRVYESQFEFDPTHKLIIYGNYKPHIKGSGDHGFWRRFVIVPFDAKFSSELGNKDVHLESKLDAELSGILNWAIAGHKKWLESEDDLTVLPARMQKEKDSYMKDQDTTGRFISEYFEYDESLPKYKSVTTGCVYGVYRDWCVNEGIKCQSSTNLIDEIIRGGFTITPTAGYKRLVGYKLKDTELVGGKVIPIALNSDDPDDETDHFKIILNE